MNKTSLLELTKIWIYPAETVWKQKKSLKKPSKISSKGTRRLFLVQIPPSVWSVWMNFESSRSLIKKCMIKSWWKIRWGNSHERNFKEILSWIVTRWSIREPVRCWILRLIRHIGKTNSKSNFCSLYRP